GVEDLATQALLAVAKCAEMIALWRRLITFELMAAAQAVDLREGATLAPATAAIHTAVRAHVATLKEDRPLGVDAEVLYASLAGGTWRGPPATG
ncbi:MAG: aromatic amino acid lyase, partial [Mesorhizobium sp.]|nr:aromatic amino acid lyase [Mesorhizobium sp.]